MITPQPGDFGLVEISGDVGKAIRFGQWLNGDGFKDFEHAFVYIGGSNGQIVEAEPGGARIATYHEYGSPIYWSTGIIGLDSLTRAKIVIAAAGYVGTPYSVADYFSLAAKHLHLWAPGLNAYVKSSGHMICSQLVEKCYSDAGQPLFGGFTGDVTPGDLCQLLDSKAGKLWR